MSIDTRMKRFSMLNMATVHVYSALFEADGAVDRDDRAYLLHLYGGNTLAGGVTSGTRRQRQIKSLIRARRC